jgi:hypothetical protein
MLSHPRTADDEREVLAGCSADIEVLGVCAEPLIVTVGRPDQGRYCQYPWIVYGRASSIDFSFARSLLLARFMAITKIGLTIREKPEGSPL